MNNPSAPLTRGTRAGLAAAALLASLLLGACPGRALTLLSYNVDNLFDGVDDGREYREFDPGRGAWTDGLFRKKLARVALAVRRAVPGGPDIVFLQEIENARTLAALRDTDLRDLGYAYAAAWPGAPAANGALAATTVGILSRFPLSRVGAHVLPARDGQPLREILEAAATVDGKTLRLFCVHWKSKTGGKAYETESARREAALVVARRVREILRDDPRAAVVAAGDFNECADEDARAGGAYRTALVRTNGRMADDAADHLVLSGRLEESGATAGGVVFFDPWLASACTPPGSYKHGGRWEGIDHILLLPGADGPAFRAFKPVCEPDMLDPRTGAPLAWDRKRPDKGFSDHLPVLMTIEY
jgi:endonuclease/exonuclease/phosphatase family metal-dependent hydrolase